MPGAVVVKSLDWAAPPTVTGLVEENTSTVQAGSLNRRNVTVPVGVNALMRLALSWTTVPTAPPGEAATSMAGLRLAMTMVKVWQAGAATLLLAQTVVGPKVPAAPAVPVTKPCGVSCRPGGRAPAVTEKIGSGLKPLTANWWR